MKSNARAFLRMGGGVSSALALSLTACSGGGGGSSPAQPPVFSSAATASVVENVTGSIYQAVASDPNGDALTYAIVGGADAQRFTISAAGQLSFVDSPNYDLPADADQNNVYEVQIAASDGKASTTLAVSVTVGNAKEGVAVRRVGTGFTNPVAMAPKDAQTMLVAEKGGAIYSLDLASGAKTLVHQIVSVGSGGVLAIAYGRGAITDGSFFVMYVRDNGFLIIAHFSRNGLGNIVEESMPVLATSAPNYAGGGGFIYTGDGLFAAIGDAGGAGDPSGSAQDDSSWLGKLVRIVPNPDPYAGASPQYFLVSKVAKGLHQPRGGTGFSNGILFADHGQAVAEELNFFTANTTGVNFGWPFKEGVRMVAGTPPAGLTDPVLEYYRTGGLRTGQSIVAGARGPSQVASLRDVVIFADQGGAIFTIKGSLLVPGKSLTSDVVERRDADFAPDAGTLKRPVAIETSPGGLVFLLDAGGDVFAVEGS
ncbi:PQQ-dependent sugar dehydrogenase [Sphingomonas pituitosa]|uniref:PQQ-dependent sugar dehydrogenase n=1 Tax=Sphingomonas pituitosa TaxID=99597 RepID=UPI000830812E|nr:PQQ-dependent sugar dehydrogenase [Sphingomonas pituitosa]